MNHWHQEFQTKYMIIHMEYLLIYAVDTILDAPPPPPPPKKKKKKKRFFFQIWIPCQNSLTRELKIRIVGILLKKLLTYFEMLIVPHAVWHTVLVSTHGPTTPLLLPSAPPQPQPHLPPTPPPPPPKKKKKKKKIRFEFFVQIHLLESSKLEL